MGYPSERDPLRAQPRRQPGRASASPTSRRSSGARRTCWCRAIARSRARSTRAPDRDEELGLGGRARPSTRSPRCTRTSRSTAAKRRRRLALRPHELRGRQHGASRAHLRRVRRPAPSLTVDPFAEVKNRIHLGVIEDLGRQIFNADVDRDTLKARVTGEIATRLAQETGIAREDRTTLAAEIADDILGHGPLERLLADETVTEIMVNGPHDIWIERKGKLSRRRCASATTSHLRRIINKMVAEVGRRIDESVPMVDARLPDGSRVNAVIPPLSLSGPLLTIRKFSKKRWDLDDLVAHGLAERGDRRLPAALHPGGAEHPRLRRHRHRQDDAAQRAVDGDPERRSHRHDRGLGRAAPQPATTSCGWSAGPSNVEGEGAVEIRDLVRNSLRMRPDRIIVGEVRGAEALDMLQAMNTGHDGSLCTAHANSARDALSRIETMVLMAGYDLPVRAIRQQVCSALDLIVHLERMMDGSRRVTTITEVQRMESDVIGLQPLFEFKIDSVTDKRSVVGVAAPDRPAPDVPRQVREARRQAARRPVPGAPTAIGAGADRAGGRAVGAAMRRSARRRRAARGCWRVRRSAGGRSGGAAELVAGRPAPTFPERSFRLTVPERRALTRRPAQGHRERRPRPRADADVGRRRPSAHDFGTVLADRHEQEHARRAPIREAMERRAAARQASAPATSSSASSLFNGKTEGPARARRATQTAIDAGAGAGAVPRARRRRSSTPSTQALDLLAQAKITAGSIVVLSDGADTGSVATASAVAPRAPQGERQDLHRRPALRLVRRERAQGPRRRPAAAATSPAESVDESRPHLPRPRRAARQRVPHPLPLVARPGREVTVAVRVDGVDGLATTHLPRAGRRVVRARRGQLLDVDARHPLTTALLCALLLALALAILLGARYRGPDVRERVGGFVSTLGRAAARQRGHRRRARSRAGRRRALARADAVVGQLQGGRARSRASRPTRSGSSS